ncbi:MAG: hypothetical protein LQ348_004597 [Seirophora lacunosa]|nr:MAG: hypothetical protein LQ348_004597 [Seirophora lacunosa]
MEHRPAAEKPQVNLLRGWPNPSLLPVAQIKAASAAALSQPDVSTPGLLYGPDPGYGPLRKGISDWLSRFYRLPYPSNPNRICITGGASQNLACLLQVFSDPLYTSFIWQVSPTYFKVCPIFEDNAFHGRLRSVPEDDEGIDVDFLKLRLQEADDDDSSTKGTLKGSQPWRKVYRHIIYAVPTFSNPSSRTMSLKRRRQLVQVARQHDALIITDDVYDQLQWPAQQPSTSSSLKHAVLPRVVDVDRELDGGTDRPGVHGFGNAVSNGSFSKIAAPGVRCGWAEGTEKIAHALSQCGGSASGGAPSQMTSTFMTHLLQTGELEKHIFNTLQPACARRYHSMMEAIERHLLPLGVTLPQSDRDVIGGYFLWFALPRPLLAEDIARVAKEEENLVIGQGSLFAVYGDERTEDLERQIRVCFSWEEEDRLAQGIERLASVISRMLDGEMSRPNRDALRERAIAHDYS